MRLAAPVAAGPASAAGAATVGSWVLALLPLQVLFGRQLNSADRAAGTRAGAQRAADELTLERYPPVLINELTACSSR